MILPESVHHMTVVLTGILNSSTHLSSHQLSDVSELFGNAKWRHAISSPPSPLCVFVVLATELCRPSKKGTQLAVEAIKQFNCLLPDNSFENTSLRGTIG
eukprot:TRINITY_DN8370_c0_g1_i1.p1 TRINITY_DN8370_c0_g1~~TRINITY_DN8370_c0_g1_i1.p1  ORF type:complete len:100 (-),score=9.99 TRINITY_DN8370_c0_g1_i1:78-377(-)